jgi:formylmethanofuran dehydrogenase subunit B
MWRANPLSTHPRYFDRYIGPDCIALAIGERSFTSEAVQHFLELPPERALDFLRLALAALRNVPSSAALATAAGFDLGELQSLIHRMRSCRFGVMLFDNHICDGQEVDALFALVAQLNRATHWGALGLGSSGNPAGAINVLASRTGHPPPVSFLDGTRRHQADCTAARMLERGEVDAFFLISPHHHTSATLSVQNIPTVVIAHHHEAMLESADVTIVTATPGLDAGGTFHRADDVPLRLVKTRNSTRPSDEGVLHQILERLTGVGE